MATLDDPNVRAALDEGELPKMSFGDHLDELRSRLIKALLAVVVAVVAMLPWHDQVTGIIVEPYRVQWRLGFEDHIAALELQVRELEAIPEPTPAQLEELRDTREYRDYSLRHKDGILAGDKLYKHTLPTRTAYPVPYHLVSINPLEDAMAFMWSALIFALVIASPVVIWQAWAFIAAGLYPKERRLFYRYFPFMIVLMASGVAFGYFLVLPYSVGFLIRWMNPEQVGAMLSIGQFLTLEFALTGALGVVFQLPLVMLALQKTGLVTHTAFRKHWRMTVLVIFLAAAVFTPPEPVSMMLMAAPMMVLYGLGLVLTWWGRKGDAKVVPA
jgi:sec-independent protein translocase protein TatC